MVSLRNFMRKTTGFTLVEAIIGIALTVIIVIGLAGTVVIIRQIAEYDKQRQAAISAARFFLEKCRHDPYPKSVTVNNIVLDNFNTPPGSDDLLARADIEIFDVNPDGTRGAKLIEIPEDYNKAVEIVVTISWNRTGSLSSRRVSEVLHTYKVPDLY